MPKSLAARLSLFAALTFTLILGIASILPAPKVEAAPAGIDKIFHLAAYILLTILWFFSFFGFSKKNFWTAIYLSATLALVYGMVIEVLQGAVTSYRTADWYDLLANITGICIAIIILIACKSRLKMLKSKF